MTPKKIKARFEKLESDVISFLTNKVENSKQTSKHMDTKIIKVNVFDYHELAIINDRLTFMNSNGYHYSLYAECSLEDLIDIINKGA